MLLYKMLIDRYQIVSRNITYIDVALSLIKLSHTSKIKKKTTHTKHKKQHKKQVH